MWLPDLEIIWNLWLFCILCLSAFCAVAVSGVWLSSLWLLAAMCLLSPLLLVPLTFVHVSFWNENFSPVPLSDTMKENLLKSFLHSHFFKTSAQFSNESRKWTGELTSTQLSELTLRKFGIRSRKFMKKNSNFKFPCKLSIRLMKKLLRERFFRWILFICFRKNRHQLKIGPASGPWNWEITNPLKSKLVRKTGPQGLKTSPFCFILFEREC